MDIQVDPEIVFRTANCAELGDDSDTEIYEGTPERRNSLPVSVERRHTSPKKVNRPDNIIENEQSRIKSKIEQLKQTLKDLENKVDDTCNQNNDCLAEGDHENVAVLQSTPTRRDAINNEFRFYPPVNVSQIEAARRVQGMSMKPSQYDGTDDLEDYISQFEILAEINGWSYEMKSLYLAGSLAGSARSLLNELDDVGRRDFKTLVRMLNLRFGSVEKAEVYRARLQTRIRGKDESLSKLAQSVRNG